jgi:exodeoxyribonuclease V beta subunit
MIGMSPRLLRPLTLRLRGSSLVEASAGTGKTYTIAALYLRLVLGHGGEEAFPRALTPPEILVVTFTEAATKELRDRIRQQLTQVAAAFSEDAARVLVRLPGEDLLHDLRAGYPSEQWPRCARLLRLAAEAMDESAVSTIHGWCNRMLREHAFDSGSLFTQALHTDESGLLAEAVRDYWRSFYYPLGAAEALQVRGWWRTPDELAKLLRTLLRADFGRPAVEAPDKLLSGMSERLQAAKEPWRQWIVEVAQVLDEAVASKALPARNYGQRNAWIGKIRDWVDGDLRVPGLSATAWERLTPPGLQAACAPGQPAPSHPGFASLEALRGNADTLVAGTREALLLHAIQWVAERLRQEKVRRAQLGFHDLLERLDAALQGPNGQRLAALIRAQFPAALIDEFQDTDPLQYRIFSTIYRTAEDDQETAMLLIGDPKQAIYGFRGADIHTYLAARRDTAGRHHTLGTNFRSTGAMVEAVNHVFRQAEDRPGPGAFLFRDGGSNPVAFFEVGANGREQRWCIDGGDAPALTLWALDAASPLSQDDHRERMSAVCASEVVRLLQGGQDGRAGFLDEQGQFAPVKPGDIAVLVNNFREATALRRALSQRRVRSVYLSDKESVYSSAVAADLQRWLGACAEPGDERLLRAAIGTATLGLSWAELDRLNHDELHWEARVMQFRGYERVWREQGVLPMLRRLMHDFGVPRRLLAQRDERALTDLLHLAELLQEASTEVVGQYALIRHLAEQRHSPEGDADTLKLRLESDADLVQVITVHKSKGLEYPLVFLPFASHCRATKQDDSHFKWREDDGEPRVALRVDETQLRRADHERLAEDVRKLYVGLTRARFATWVGAALTRDLDKSALGWLLSGGQPVAAGALLGQLQALKGQCPDIAAIAAPSPEFESYRAEAAVAEPKPAPVLPSASRERWWIASYSALRTEQGSPAGPSTAAEDTYSESHGDPTEKVSAGQGGEASSQGAASEVAQGMHAFPAGPAAGTFLHSLLEWAGRKGFARALDESADIADFIARRCNLAGYSRFTPVLREWMVSWLSTRWNLEPLVPGASPVSPSEFGAIQVEMEFWFPSARVDTRALDALVVRHTLDAAPRAGLQPNKLNGMLKGFIDLVFEHEGRFYVADYKSNRLGLRDEHYTPQAMRNAVLHHRYELQYSLYTLALHRLLRSRMPDYDYERHVGGAVYLFLRGSAAPRGGLHLERPPLALIEGLDALFEGGAITPHPEVAR